MSGWTFKAWFGTETGQWIAFAKQGPIAASTIREAMLEPGDLWFAFATTEAEAIAKLKREVLH
jgi:hypothetical protein